MSWTGPNTGDPVGDEINADGGSYAVNGAPAGSYTITMTDANGCTATATTTVIEPLALGASAVSTAAICNGSADGTITVTATDGTAPYNVSWTGQSSGDPIGDEIASSGANYLISSLNPGSYTITVTDANGCTTQTTSTVTQPIALSASATNTAALCNGSADGTITVTATDGTPVYNVSWTGPVSGDPAGNEITISGGNYTITGVSAGTYTITVTDANGCATTTTSTITEPTTVSATATNTSVLCNGGTTGSVTGLASGGTAPYDMSWSGPNTGDPAGDEINTDGGSYTVNGAPAGTYTITMTDGNGCVATTTTQIIEPAGLTASALNTAVLCNAGSSGTVQGSATGGTAPYNMSWTGPNTGNPAGDEINVDGGSYTVNGAPAGSYTITMTDGNGCTATATTTVIEPAILQVNSAPVPPLCNGVFNGSMNVTATGGTAPYDVSWSGPNSDNPIGTEIIANGGIYTITGVGAGTYTITLTDGNGCVTTTTTTLVPPVALTISTQPVDVACSGGNTGSIQVVANNGTPGYNVSWSGVATGNPNGIEINTSGGSYTIPSLIAGSYTVFVSDLNGCIDSNIVQIIEPTAISEQNLTTPALCSTSLDGTVGITVSGGIAPYNLELNGGTLSNPPGDEIISSGGSYTFTNLAIGNYTVIITDNNNCSITTSITINTNNNPPTVTMVNDTICTGQSATLIPVVNPSGGTFLWGNGSSGATLTISPITTTQYAVLYNYSGCLAQGSAFVVVNPIPTVTLSNETICAGESVTLSPASAQPSGGSYSWSTNNTNSSITVNPTSTSNYSLTYTVNGCSSTPASAIVTVNPVPTLTINSPAICIGETATLTATPNLPGGSVVWTPTNETTTSIDVTPVITSTYSAIYILNGCSSNSVSTSVTVNAIPNVSFDVSILEGCSPLSVQLWNTSQDANLSTLTEWAIDNSSNFNGDTINPTLFSGCHDITLSMTVNGCVGTVTYDDFICAESIPVASFSPNINSFTESSQAIELINQSIGASSYSWNMGDGTFYTTTDVTHMYGQTSSGQTIWLTATSDLGCVDSTSITIPYEDAIIYFIPNTFTPDGNEFNNIFLPVFTAGIDFHTFEMSIFNRWGEVIFYSDDPTRGWEGTFGNQGLDVQSGVYTYLISFKTPQLDDRQIITGHVNLIR
jgi:gliding motility-associated-like protein